MLRNGQSRLGKQLAPFLAVVNAVALQLVFETFASIRFVLRVPPGAKGPSITRKRYCVQSE